MSTQSFQAASNAPCSNSSSTASQISGGTIDGLKVEMKERQLDSEFSPKSVQTHFSPVINHTSSSASASSSYTPHVQDHDLYSLSINRKRDDINVDEQIRLPMKQVSNKNEDFYNLKVPYLSYTENDREMSTDATRYKAHFSDENENDEDVFPFRTADSSRHSDLMSYYNQVSDQQKVSHPFSSSLTNHNKDKKSVEAPLVNREITSQQNSSISMATPTSTNMNINNASIPQSHSQQPVVGVGEDSIPPFAVSMSNSDMHTIVFSNVNLNSGFSSPLNYDQTSKNDNDQSINFSKLMRQADDTVLSAIESPTKTNNYSKDVNNDRSTQASSVIPKEERIERSNVLGKSYVSSTQRMFSQKATKEITLSHMTSDSFQLCVQLSPNVSVRDVVDVVANPDLLRFWCEPVTGLVVTDHKGGSMSSPGDRRINNSNHLGNYQYPNIEECDDDVIIPPAEDVVTINSKALEQREEYSDGEWIKASTPEIILPQAHETFIDNCIKKVSNMLGFPGYGNVTMFIERSRAQIGFTLGPFKNGTMLQHKITVIEQKDQPNNFEGGGVILMDNVTMLPNDETNIEDDEGWILLCSCFESMLDITRSWYKASLDGYIDQTMSSLRNLVDLVEAGGESHVGYGRDNVGMVSNDQSQPLLM